MIPEFFNPQLLRENLQEAIPVVDVVNLANDVMAELEAAEGVCTETLSLALGVVVGRVLKLAEERRGTWRNLRRGIVVLKEGM